MPKTKLGKWSVGLHVFFLIIIITSIILVKVFGILNFGDHWWDVTVPVAFLTSLIALILGIIAVSKKNERSIFVVLSIILGIMVILFVLLHSLFIND